MRVTFAALVCAIAIGSFVLASVWFPDLDRASLLIAAFPLLSSSTPIPRGSKTLRQTDLSTKNSSKTQFSWRTELCNLAAFFNLKGATCRPPMPHKSQYSVRSNVLDK